MTSPTVTVADLLSGRCDAFGVPIELLSGEAGNGRLIASPHIQKTGLALAGFHDYLQPARILVFGESEVRYIDRLSADERLRVVTAVFSHDIPCVLITGGWEPSGELLAAIQRCLRDSGA